MMADVQGDSSGFFQWAFGIVLAVIGALLGVVWNSMNGRLDEMQKDIDKRALAEDVQELQHDKRTSHGELSTEIKNTELRLRTEFQREIDTVKSQNKSQHEENREALADLREENRQQSSTIQNALMDIAQRIPRRGGQ